MALRSSVGMERLLNSYLPPGEIDRLGGGLKAAHAARGMAASHPNACVFTSSRGAVATKALARGGALDGRQVYIETSLLDHRSSRSPPAASTGSRSTRSTGEETLASLDPATISPRLLAGDRLTTAPRARRHARQLTRAVDGSDVRAFHPDAVGCDLILDGRTSAMDPIGGTALPRRRSWRIIRRDRRIACASGSRAARAGSATTRTGSSRRSATSTCISSTRARTVGSGKFSGRTSARSTASRASRFRSGRRTRGGSRSSAISRGGTAGCSRCGACGARASSSCSSRASKRGAVYKFEIKTREGMLRLKTDPMARAMEVPPQSASRVECDVVRLGRHRLDEGAAHGRSRARLRSRPYEVHLGSCGEGDDGGRPHAELPRDRASPRRAREGAAASRTSS